jgi:hypothetical protein
MEIKSVSAYYSLKLQLGVQMAKWILYASMLRRLGSREIRYGSFRSATAGRVGVSDPGTCSYMLVQVLVANCHVVLMLST